jgi:hypothetical protein
MSHVIDVPTAPDVDDDSVDDQAPLGPADRCDRCVAQAYVRVRQGEQTLLFCGHHYTRFEARLIEFAEAIDDYRERIPS